MPFYAIATVPLIRKLDSNIHQVWYADDAAGVGKLGNGGTRSALSALVMATSQMLQKHG